MASSRVGFIWVYVLIAMFAVGIMELIVIPAITFKLVPTLQLSANLTLNAADAAAFAEKTVMHIKFIHMAMYMVLFVLFVYAMISVFKREENEYYQP